MAIDDYTFDIHWSPEDVEYVGTVDEMPSLSWLDPDTDAALSGIRSLVADEAASIDPPPRLQ